MISDTEPTDMPAICAVLISDIREGGRVDRGSDI
jgi:hypothetical protein